MTFATEKYSFIVDSVRSFSFFQYNVSNDSSFLPSDSPVFDGVRYDCDI